MEWFNRLLKIGITGAKRLKDADLEDLLSKAPDEIKPLVEKIVRGEKLTTKEKKIMVKSTKNIREEDIFHPTNGKFIFTDRAINELAEKGKEKLVKFANLELDEEGTEKLAGVLEAIVREKRKAIAMREGMADPRYGVDPDFTVSVNKQGDIAYNADLGFDSKVAASFAPFRFDVMEVNTPALYQKWVNQSYEALGKFISAGDDEIIYTQDELLSLSSQSGWTDLFRWAANNDPKVADLGNFPNPSYANKGIYLYHSINEEVKRLSTLVVKGKADKGLTPQETELKLASTILATENFMPGVAHGRGFGGLSMSEGRSSRLANAVKALSGMRKSEAETIAEADAIATKYATELSNLYSEFDANNVKDFAKHYIRLHDDGRDVFLSGFKKWMTTRTKDGKLPWSEWLKNGYTASLLANPKTWYKAAKSMLGQKGLYYIKKEISAGVSGPLLREVIEPGVVAANNFTGKLTRKVGGLPENVSPYDPMGVGANWSHHILSGQKWQNSEFMDAWIGTVAMNEVFPIAIRNALAVAKRNDSLDSGTKKGLYNTMDVYKDIGDYLSDKGMNKTAFATSKLPKVGFYALGGLDDSVKTLTVAKELLTDAYKEAQKVFEETGDYQQYINKLVSVMTEPSKYLDKAIDIGRDVTLTNKIVKDGNAIERFVNAGYKSVDNLALKTHIPLPRIIINSMAAGKDYVPGAFVMSSRRTQQLMEGGDLAEDIITKQILGGLVAYSLMDNYCNPENPDQLFCIANAASNEQERNFYEANGISEWSINFRKNKNDRFKSIGTETLEGIKYPIHVFAEVAKKINNMDLDLTDTPDLISATATGLFEFMTVDTIFDLHEDILRVLNVFNNSDPETADDVLLDKVSSVVAEGVLKYGDALTTNMGANPSTARFVSDIFDPVSRATTPESISQGGRFDATKYIYNNIVQKKQNDWRFVIDTLPGVEPNVPSLDNFGNEKNKDLPIGLFEDQKAHVSVNNRESVNYLAQNGIEIPDTGMAYLDLGEDFGRVKLNQAERYQVQKYFTNQPIELRDRNGELMFPDKGAMPLWDAVDELTTGDSKTSNVFRSLPLEGDYTQTKELDWVLRQYMDNTKEYFMSIPSFANKAMMLEQAEKR